MADAAKYLPVNGGTFISDIGSLLSVLKTRRTMAFVYGIMFAFVAFTAFLAFNPSPNSSSPWFNNIFSIGTTRSSTSTDPYRSQFTSVFSYLFPNNSSSQQEVRDFASPPNQTDSIGSISSISQSPSSNEAHPVAKNTTSESPVITKAQTTSQDHTQSTGNTDAPAALHANQSRVAPTVNEHPSTTNNRTQSDQNFTPQPLKPNLTTSGAPKAPVVAKPTTTAVPKAPVAANRTTIPVSKAPVASNQSTLSVSLEKERPQKGEKGVADDGLSSNYTASPSKGQSNGTIQKDGADSEVSAEQEIENWKQSLMKCDLFDGEWVRDDSYPLYKGGSCTLIDEQFNCVLNGRPDLEYHKLKWKPKGCSLPRFNGAHMLELLRGKRLAFVGDSLNRNMWESLVCILKGSVKDQSKVFEAHGRQIFRGEASYSFIFKDYNCTVEFFVSPFLVQEWEYADKNGIKKETLRLDLVGRSSDQYKGADIIIFNTGHWWTHEKTSKGKDYYQEGSHVYSELNVLEAFRKALTTWGRWVDANINPAKSLVFFRGYSASHFSGGQWNSGGACDSETEPIKNETYLSAYPPKMQVLESVLKGMKTHVTYLNITRLTDYRKDGHPSIYRKKKLSDEERKSPLRYQDCSHWCLPGVPDAWNELFYAELLVKENKMRQRQRRP